MIRLLAVTLMVGLFGLTGVAAVRVGAEPRDRTVTGAGASGQEPASVTGLYRNHSAAYYAWRFRQRTQQLQAARRRAHALTRMLLHRPSVTEAINLASVVYGNGSTLWRRARCESKLDPNAKNGSEASGLLQFLPSTWATTPFSRFSIFSPYANALAAGWMIGPAGRGGEWSCR